MAVEVRARAPRPTQQQIETAFAAWLEVADPTPCSIRHAMQESFWSGYIFARIAAVRGYEVAIAVFTGRETPEGPP
jgi:hypothetical protein